MQQAVFPFRALVLGGLAVLAWALAFTFGIVIIIGALKMMRLKSYNWALAASVLALLPCNPAGVLGLVTGIWGLVVLNRPAVKAAFESGRSGPPTSVSGKSHLWWLWLVLLAVCSVCVVPVAAIALY